MNTQKKAYLYAIIAVLLWSTVASAFKLTLRYLNVVNLLFYSSLVSSISFFIILIFHGKLKKLKEYGLNDYLHSFILGLLNPFLYYLILFKAYSLLPAQEALTLNYLWPVTITLLSIPILKQRIGKKSILAIIVSFIGVTVIATRGNLKQLKFSNPLGVTLALLSTVIWALFWLYNVKDKRDEVPKLFLNFSFGFLFVSIYIFIFFEFKIPAIEGLMGSIYIGLFEMGITFIMWLKALKLSKITAKVNNLIFLSPFISLFFIEIFVGEEILIATFIGLVLIISGILIQRNA